MEQLEFPFIARERILDQLQDLFAWLNKVGPQLYANDADEGRRLVDLIWEEVKK
jgi:hypothetical protein